MIFIAIDFSFDCKISIIYKSTQAVQAKIKIINYVTYWLSVVVVYIASLKIKTFAIQITLDYTLNGRAKFGHNKNIV